jgi:hypothetical protein
LSLACHGLDKLKVNRPGAAVLTKVVALLATE